MKAALLLLPALGAANHYPDWFVQKLKGADLSDTYDECDASTCEPPAHKFAKMLPVLPGIQWMQHGGYCGAWSIQRAAMAKGAYVSQQQVRDHAAPGGGHDEEILATNIDGALQKLKIRAEGFPRNDLPAPESDEYLKFMKKHLVAGNPNIWMIMFDGQQYPIPGYVYPNASMGIYGHVEPVVGILSNHPLSDETVYEDDAFAYFDDASKVTYYVSPKKVPGTCKLDSSGSCNAHCSSGGFFGGQCVWNQRGYIWAVEDLLDSREAVPVSLSISPWASEPYTRGGAKPINITGTLTASGLKVGSEYEIHRWGSAEDAFSYSAASRVKTFTATSDTYVFHDPVKFLSSSATYYRCVESSAETLVV